jgi:hypothetical protein
VEDLFEGHGVAAHLPISEEIAVARPGAILDGNLVLTVLTLEAHLETIDAHAMALPCVRPCLFDLPDEAGLHFWDLPPGWETQTAAHVAPPWFHAWVLE